MHIDINQTVHEQWGIGLKHRYQLILASVVYVRREMSLHFPSDAYMRIYPVNLQGH